MTRILDGKSIAQKIQDEVKQEIEQMHARGVDFNLTVVLVGEHPASASYVKNKQRTAEALGMQGKVIRCSDEIRQDELLSIVDNLNRDDTVDGILVQLPLPDHIDEQSILQRILPEKDVDGFHPLTAGRNFVGLTAVWPCTPAGIMEMLRIEGLEVAGRHAVVVGRSNIVGKPMAMLLLQANATVTICHSRTPNLAHFTRDADILVAAVGKANVIQSEHVKPGAIVIDVGMNRVDGKLTGDVDFTNVAPVAGAITPVPGGVGPLTVSMLMKNTVTLGKIRRGVV